MEEIGYVVGCPNPRSVAEFIVGKRIDWSKQKDEFETLADCFGITREGYLSDESPLFTPDAAMDEDGNVYAFSGEEQKARLVSFMEKYARPEKVKRKTATLARRANVKTPPNPNELTQVQKRQRTLDFLLGKEDKRTTAVPRMLMRSEEKIIRKENAADEPYMPSGMEWKDKGYFFNETAKFTDICQKSIGDCYFLSALCSVTFVNSFRIKNATAPRATAIEGPKDDSPLHLIDFYVPDWPMEKGIAWWKDQKKTVHSVVVSEEILVSTSSGQNYGACGPKELVKKTSARKSDADACWPAVYEKAYAKFLEGTKNDYPNMGKGSHIWCGYSRDALKEILHTEDVKANMLKNLTVERIEEICRAAFSHPTCTSIYGYIQMLPDKGEYHYSEAGSKSYYEEKLGLYTAHEYSLLGCIDLDDKTYVILRNPHGCNLQSMRNNPNIYHVDWNFDMNRDLVGNNNLGRTSDMDSASDLSDSYDLNICCDSNDNKLHTNKLCATTQYIYLSGTDDPNSSNGLFLLEINEYKRVFTDITYYTGSDFIELE